MFVSMNATQTTGLDDGFLNADFITVYDSHGVDPSNTYSYKRGALSAHVYTHPGVYTIRTYVESAGRRAESAPITVTVHDPNVYYSRTVCFSSFARRNFAGCPNRDARNHVITDDFQAALNYGAAFTRLLFDAGSTWNIRSVSARGPGPLHIGDYQDPASSVRQRPRLNSHGQGYSTAMILGDISEVVLSGFQITGDYTGSSSDPNTSGINVDGTTNALIYDNIIERTNGSAIYVGFRHSQLGIVGNLIRMSGEYGIYGGPNHLFIMQNTIDDVRSQHGIRSESGQYSYFWKNVLRNILGHTSITVRGNQHTALIMNNYLEQILAVNPEYQGSVTYQRDVLIDGNFIRPRAGAALLNFAIRCAADNLVVRNNIAYRVSTFFTADTYQTVGACRNARIVHNTIVNDQNIVGNSHQLLLATPAATNISLLHNLYLSFSSSSEGRVIHFPGPINQLRSDGNLFYVPNLASSWRGFFVDGTSYTFANWQGLMLDSNSINANPQFVSLDPAHPGFLVPESFSPLVDAAEGVVALTNNFDGLGELRPIDGDGDRRAVPDIGAVERQ